MRIAFGGSLTVSAEERWFTEIRAGRAFMRGSDTGASAGNYGHFQLFNPGGSGIMIVVRRLVASLRTADTIRIHTHNTALTTLLGAGVNLLAGGTVGIGEVRRQNIASFTGTLVSAVPISADRPYNLLDGWSWELGAGEGILFVSATVNVAIGGFYEWIEI